MRILLINSEYPPIGGGAGNASQYVAEHMAAAGHDVTVLTTKFKNLPWQEIRNGVRIVRATARRKRMDRSMAHEQVAFILGGGFRSMGIVLREKPDVVLAFFGMPSGAIAFPLRVLFRIPYIISLRGGDVPGFRPYDFALYHKLVSPVLRVIWRKAGAVIANSGGLRALGQQFERRVPIEIIPNGVDSERFAPGERDWKTPHMLFVGRVVYQKGLDILLHSLANFTHLSWDLTVVGDGPLRPSLEALAHNLGIGDRVRFAGWLKDEALVAEYRRANLFPYPSRHEGMPNAVLEAMAAGLPVIATRIAGNEELVLDGKTGILVEKENQLAFEKALARLLDAPAKRQALGEAARRRVQADYPWERVASRYLQIMERIRRD